MSNLPLTHFPPPAMPTNTLSWRSNGTRTATGSSRPHEITSSSCLTWETWRKSYRLLKGTRKKLQVCEILFICFQFVSTNFIMPPTSTKLKGGYTGFTLSVRPLTRPDLHHVVGLFILREVRLCVCGQNRVCAVSSTILIGSISYLHILSSNFRRCVACTVCFKI